MSTKSLEKSFEVEQLKIFVALPNGFS